MREKLISLIVLSLDTIIYLYSLQIPGHLVHYLNRIKEEKTFIQKRKTRLAVDRVNL